MKLSQYKAITPTLYADLEAAFAKHGLKTGKLDAGVDEAHGMVKLSIQLVDLCMTDSRGEPTTPERQRWEQSAMLYGLADAEKAWLGQSFDNGVWSYTVAGLINSRSDKVVSIQRNDGKTFRTTITDLRRQMAPMRAAKVA